MSNTSVITYIRQQSVAIMQLIEKTEQITDGLANDDLMGIFLKHDIKTLRMMVSRNQSYIEYIEKKGSES